MEGTAVFKQWAPSWSKRAVIKNAIRAVAPSPGTASPSVIIPDGVRSESPFTRALFELGDFHRFVFVMSILEGFNDHESGLLLKCSPKEVAKARGQALRQLAAAVGPRPAATALEHGSAFLAVSAVA